MYVLVAKKIKRIRILKGRVTQYKFIFLFGD